MTGDWVTGILCRLGGERLRILHNLLGFLDPAVFDAAHYVARHPAAAQSRLPARWHFLLFGMRRGSSPHPAFDPDFYRSANPDVAAAGTAPFLHFIRYGWREGRKPSPFFDPAYYLEHSPDVAAAGLNPLLHYLLHGRREGRPALNRVRVLQVYHVLGGGVATHCEDISAGLIRENVEVWTLQGDGETSFRLICQEQEFDHTYPAAGNDDSTLMADLRAIGLNLIHIHSVIGFGTRLIDWLKHLGVAYDVTVHDYTFLCPRVTLLDGRDRYCGEDRRAEVCDACVSRWGGYPHLMDTYGACGSTASWRRLWGNFLARARQIYVPDQGVIDRFAPHLPLPAPILRPHPEPLRAIPIARPYGGDEMRVALIGAIGPHKGAQTLVDCARAALRQGLPLHFHVIGEISIPIDPAELPNVTVTGRYRREDLPALIEASSCRLATFLSIAPETFMYTLGEALAGGLYPVVLDRGAPPGRLKALGWGSVLPADADSDTINHELMARGLDRPLPPAGLVLGYSYASLWEDYYQRGRRDRTGTPAADLIRHRHDYSTLEALLRCFAAASELDDIAEPDEMTEPALVIVPIHGGKAHLPAFLASLDRHTPVGTRIIVVDDGNRDHEILTQLKRFTAHRSGAELIRLPENRGYVEAVTAGYRRRRGEHVIVLNTDIILPSGWMPRLLRPLRSPEVASATPFGSSASICGFPHIPDDNPLFLGLDVDTIDEALRRLSPDLPPLVIPTGVGFCMAMSRHALDRIGFIEQQTFGAGYGEENDWCQKAVRQGLVNVLVPNLFVYHAHGGSFDPVEKKRLGKRNMDILLARYPDYLNEVDQLVQADPLAKLRAFVAFQLAAQARGGALLVVAGENAEANIAPASPSVSVRLSACSPDWTVRFRSEAGEFQVRGSNLAELPALVSRVTVSRVLATGLTASWSPLALARVLAEVVRRIPTFTLVVDGAMLDPSRWPGPSRWTDGATDGVEWLYRLASLCERADQIQFFSPTVQAHFEALFNAAAQPAPLLAPQRQAKVEAIRSHADFCAGERDHPAHPLELFIEVSNTCNLSCVMCRDFSVASPVRAQRLREVSRGLMDVDDMVRRLEPALRHALAVHCFGFGEPTIHPDFPRILERLSAFEVMIDFFTNGMALAGDLGDLVVDAGVQQITISLSGASAAVYEKYYVGGRFEDVLAGIRRVADRKRRTGRHFPRLVVNSLGFAEHVEHFDQFVALMADLGVQTILLQPLQAYPHMPELAGLASIMRPWVEGEILARAEAIGTQRGVSVITGAYAACGVADAADYQARLRAQSEQAGRKADIRPKPASPGALSPDEPIAEVRGKLDVGPVDGTTGFHCLEPFKTLYVGRNGAAKACCFASDRSWFLGDVTAAPVESVWDGAGFRAVREAVLAGHYPRSACAGCLKAGLAPTAASSIELVETYLHWHAARFGAGLRERLSDGTLSAIAEGLLARSGV